MVPISRALVAWLGACAVAHADPPGDGEPPPPDPDRVELGGLPAIAYNSDAGFGFGVIGVLAGFEDGWTPYRWRIEGKVFSTVREGPDGAEFPFHDHYVKVDMPGHLRGTRVQIKAGFAQSISLWHGLGNASEAFAGRPRDVRYTHRYPTAELAARVPIVGPLHARVLGSFTYNWLDIGGDTKLARDAAGDSGPYVRDSVVGTRDHALWVAQAGLEWDSRDHETAPRSGMLHDLSARYGVGGEGDFQFAAFNATARVYVALWRDFLVVAARLMGDVTVGRAPMYELAILGDSLLVRGVPWRRYHGRLRALGNVELRSWFLPFRAFSQRLNLGAVAFFDAGRLWADTEPHPELDGTGAGLKLGVGGGVRIQWGEAMIVRLDSAWSPDGIGVYVGLGHIF